MKKTMFGLLLLIGVLVQSCGSTTSFYGINKARARKGEPKITREQYKERVRACKSHDTDPQHPGGVPREARPPKKLRMGWSG